MPLPSAQVEHEIPGRMRLRIPERRGDPAFFTALEQRFGEATWLRQVRTNRRTASVLLLYAGAAADDVAAFAKEARLFAIEPAPPLAPRGTSALGGRRPHPLWLAAAGFAGLGLYQAARGQILGNAVESLWHAYALKRTWQRPRLALGLASLGLYQLLAGRVLGSASSLLIYAANAHSMARRNGAAGPPE
jgi:hypothetical protein